jgi:hypothetical protein
VVGGSYFDFCQLYWCALLVEWWNKRRLSLTTLESSDPQQNGLLLSTKDAIHTHDPKDLSRLFDSVHADPDVKPVKGAFKTLTAIQNLGDVRDLSLLPNRKRSSPVERVARSFCIAPVASTKVPEG